VDVAPARAVLLDVAATLPADGQGALRAARLDRSHHHSGAPHCSASRLTLACHACSGPLAAAPEATEERHGAKLSRRDRCVHAVDCAIVARYVIAR
jgi:hypothetical protein